MKAEDIAKGNDLFRATLIASPRHKVLVTQGVDQSPDKEHIIKAVRTYKGFTDTYKEHNFGGFHYNGRKYVWKIDYYDPSFRTGANPYTEDFARVLTIMTAEEY